MNSEPVNACNAGVLGLKVSAKALNSADVFRNTRGVALILTILIVSLIVALTLEFNRNMRTNVVSAGHIGHGLKALYAAKSGVSYGLAMLMADDKKVDTLSEQWADVEYLAGVSAGSQALLAGGYFELQIEDLSGKIQINKLADNHELEKIFEKFLALEEFGLEQEEVNTIRDSVMDWIDKADEEDDFIRLSGAEDDYYMSLERPYHCKNGPLDSPEELLLVKGITPELFYGTEDRPGIAPHISVFGEDGKININTADPKFPKADPMVLMSLNEEMTKVMAEDMATYRIDADEDRLSDSKWYREAVPGDIEIPKGIITTKSSHFQVTSIGHFGDVTKSVKAVVKRDPDKQDFQILSWKIE